MALAAASRVHPTQRAAPYRPSNHPVRFSYSQTSKPNKPHKASSEHRTEKAAFKELKKEQIPPHVLDKFAHYGKLKSTKPDPYPNLKLVGAAPEELDEKTCGQSWELNRELEKRIIKKPK